MRNFPQLLREGGVELGVGVAVEVRPNRGIRVKIFVAVDIAQHRALARRNHDRLASEPILHLGEWMPDVAMIQFSELVHCSNAAQKMPDAEYDRAASESKQAR